MQMLTSFSYISTPTATTLILGSMPGQKSLDDNQYYAHPRNAFWKIMATLYGFDTELNYEQRCIELTNNKIALWDVMQHCERQGSLDSSIVEKSIIPNDFLLFFAEHPKINRIYFNGQKAEKSFQKYVVPMLLNTKHFDLILLPSTSPAHASMTFAQKLIQWQQALS